jgi:hypothetical protein
MILICYNAFEADILSLEMTNQLNQTNSVALVRERTVPTKRPPLVGEVSANLK